MTTGILLSGGMDSLSIAWWKRPHIAITINYGQLPAEAEIAAAAAVCSRLKIQHHIVHVDCSALGTGDMAGRQASSHSTASDWWPYRNQMLLTFAAMKAISLDVRILYIGTVRSDSFHLDGSSEFVAAIDRLISMQEGGLHVEAPAIGLSTTELVRIAGVPDNLLAWAHSCHRANVACGNCRGCNKYFDVLNELHS